MSRRYPLLGMPFPSSGIFAAELEDQQNSQTAGDIDGAVKNRRRARWYETLVKFIKQRVAYNEEHT